MPILPILFVYLIFAFPRTFSEGKLTLIALVTLHLAFLVHQKRIYVSRHVLQVYTAFSLVGLCAGLTGVIQGNPVSAVMDGLRLYVLWSLLIIVLYTYMIKFGALVIIHHAAILASLTTAGINLVLVATEYFGVTVFPDWLRREMLLFVGFHDGYVQVVAHNIGMLFFLVPYLLVTVWRADSRQEKRCFVWLALGVSMLAAILSGRRALWIVIFLVPYLLWFVTFVSGTKERLRAYQSTIFMMVIGAICTVYIVTSPLTGATLDRLSSAFSAEDERTIQSSFLIEGFLNNFFFGSGFGGYAGYTRDYDSPWMYELSYHQFIFNHGVLAAGITMIGIAFAFFKALRRIKSSGVSTHNGAFAILLGVIGLAIGSYSNPYLSSFDFIFVIGFLVLIGSCLKQRHLSAELFDRSVGKQAKSGSLS